MSKIPSFKNFSKSKFSVSDVNKSNVGVETPTYIKNFDVRIWKKSVNSSNCHPELAAPLVADEKEAYKGGCSQSISGSSPQQKCSAICTQKSNVGLKAQPTLISVSPRRRSIVMQCLRPHLPHRVAFTLAEVLITLGIIGVVAAMTLPTLIAKYQERVLVTSAKKGYSILLNALNKWNANNDITGEYVTFFTSGEDSDLNKEFSKLLNSINVCVSTSEVEKKCGGSYDIKQYKKLNNGNGQTQTATWFNAYRIILADGMFINITRRTAVDNDCIYTYISYDRDADGNYIKDSAKEVSTPTCGWINIDTNGLKPPNQVGRDVFRLNIMKEKISANSDNGGNLEYILKYDKLIKTENYTPGEY